MHSYRVPKKRVAVRVALRNQPEMSGSIFLGERAERHTGPERPSDVMNCDAPFFAIEETSGAVAFVSRQAVAFVAAPIRAELDHVEAEDHTAFEISITLDDGRSLEGLVRYRLPDSASRLQDFLNLPDRFLCLERADEVLLVNKRRMVSARLLPRKGEPGGED